MCQIVQYSQRKASTRLLWDGQSFTGIDKIIIPMNISGGHWTMLVSIVKSFTGLISQTIPIIRCMKFCQVLDWTSKVCYYYDPMNESARQLTASSNPSLAGLIHKLRYDFFLFYNLFFSLTLKPFYKLHILVIVSNQRQI